MASRRKLLSYEQIESDSQTGPELSQMVNFFMGLWNLGVTLVRRRFVM